MPRSETCPDCREVVPPGSCLRHHLPRPRPVVLQRCGRCGAMVGPGHDALACRDDRRVDPSGLLAR